MARVIKIDNALKKRFAKKASKKKSRELVAYFLIVCEGEKTEPNYFKSFPKKSGKIVYDLKFDGGGISTLKVVEKAIELRDSSKQKYDRVWAVFDRDSFKSNPFKYKKNSLTMYSILQKHGNQEQAIKWARELNNSFEGEKYSDFNPSTQVYKLVEELTGKSEKFTKEIIKKFNEGK